MSRWILCVAALGLPGLLGCTGSPPAGDGTSAAGNGDAAAPAAPTAPAATSDAAPATPDAAATPDATTDAAAADAGKSVAELLAAGDQAYNTGDYEAAYKSYVKVRDEHQVDDDAQLFHRLGVCLQQSLETGRNDRGSAAYRQAIDAYDRAVALKDSPETRFNRALLLAVHEDPSRLETAVTDFEALLAATPADHEARINLGVAAHRLANHWADATPPEPARAREFADRARARYEQAINAADCGAALKQTARLNHALLLCRHLPERKDEGLSALRAWLTAQPPMGDDAPQWQKDRRAALRALAGIEAPPAPANGAAPAPAAPAAPAPAEAPAPPEKPAAETPVKPATPAPPAAAPSPDQPAAPAPEKPVTPAPEKPATPAPPGPPSPVAPAQPATPPGAAPAEGTPAAPPAPTEGVPPAPAPAPAAAAPLVPSPDKPATPASEEAAPPAAPAPPPPAERP